MNHLFLQSIHIYSGRNGMDGLSGLDGFPGQPGKPGDSGKDGKVDYPNWIEKVKNFKSIIFFTCDYITEW